MKKTISVLVTVILLLPVFGCAPASGSYSAKNIEEGYFVSEIFPLLSFIVPEGYEIVDEIEGTKGSSGGLWRLKLYNKEKDEMISIDYLDWREAVDGSWEMWLWESPLRYIDGVATIAPLVSINDDYEIRHYDIWPRELEMNEILVLPRDNDNIVGMINIRYQDQLSDALIIAESMKPSLLTREVYEDFAF